MVNGNKAVEFITTCARNELEQIVFNYVQLDFYQLKDMFGNETSLIASTATKAAILIEYSIVQDKFGYCTEQMLVERLLSMGYYSKFIQVSSSIELPHVVS